MSDEKLQMHDEPGVFRRFLSSVELPFFFYVFGLMMHMPIIQQYAYYRFSIEAHFPYELSGHETNCKGKALNHTLKLLQEEVQKKSAHFQIAQSLCNTLPSLFVCLIYGSWSDKVGRKPIIILGMFGSLLDTMCILLTISFELPLSFILVGNFLNGIGGYITGLLLSVMAYVADTTGEEDRALRLGIIEAVVFLGSMVSQFLSGHLISSIGFKKSYILVVFCLLVACFCSIFLLKESLVGKKPNICKTIFNKATLKYPIHVWSVLTKPRPNKWKIGIMFPATLFVNMLSMGISSVITLYILNSPFCLQPIKVGYFTGTRYLVLGMGAALGIKLLSKVLQQHSISLIGIVSYTAFYTLLSFAQSQAMLYVAVAAGAVTGTVGPIFRSILSQTVGPDEQGALFSAVSSFEMLAVFICTFIFNAVYPIVNDAGYPGSIFYLVDALLLLPLIFNVIYAVKVKKKTHDEELQNVIEERSTNPGDDNAQISVYGSNDSTPPTTPIV